MKITTINFKRNVKNPKSSEGESRILSSFNYVLNQVYSTKTLAEAFNLGSIIRLGSNIKNLVEFLCGMIKKHQKMQHFRTSLRI